MRGAHPLAKLHATGQPDIHYHQVGRERQSLLQSRDFGGQPMVLTALEDITATSP